VGPALLDEGDHDRVMKNLHAFEFTTNEFGLFARPLWDQRTLRDPGNEMSSL
jgi:hypothetical protein